MAPASAALTWRSLLLMATLDGQADSGDDPAAKQHAPAGLRSDANAANRQLSRPQFATGGSGCCTSFDPLCFRATALSAAGN